ncbi:MAG TPA: MFS transporter [Pseudonocardia sp.]
MTTATAQRGSSPPSGELSHRQILTILVGLLLGMFLAALDQTVVSTAIRTIADDLGGLSEQAWATTAFLITSTITTPLYGKLSDIYGRKPFFLLAISIFLIGSVTCTFAQSMYQLAAFRALQGIGAGGLFSLALTILGDIVPPRERARYQGFFLAVFGTSSVLGPVIGGLLSGASNILGLEGWRWIFLVNVPIGAVALVVVARFLNVPHVPRGRPRIDWPGAIMLAVGLVPLLIVAEQGRTWGWGSFTSIVCYAIGGVGLILFVIIERWYRDDALLPLRLFRNSVFSLVTVIGIIVGMGMFGGIAVLPQFLQIVRGASPIQSGFLMLPLVAGIMVASVTSGQLTSRTGRYKVFPVVGTMLMTGALVVMSFRVNVDIPFWELDLYMAMFGLGLGSCMQTLVLAVQNASPARDMGVVTASSTFFRQLGGTIGTAVFFSILFSTLPDKIRGALSSAGQGDPAFQAAVADPAVRANPVNQPFFALAQSTGGSNSNVLSDSAFLQTIDARLAHPILVGFSESVTLVLLVAACVVAVAFLLVLFVKELPLRTMSGAQAAAMEAAARTGEVPAAVPTEAVRTAAPVVDTAPTVPIGRHALTGTDGAMNGTTNGTTNGNGHAAHNGHPVAEVVPLSGPGLVGTVRRVDGPGLGQVVVTIADLTGRQEARAGTDEEGRYAVALPHEGMYLVVAAAPAYEPHAAMVDVGAAVPTRHDVLLSGTSAVYGVIRNGTEPVGGAAVALIDAQGDVAAAGVADGIGRYQLAGVPDGSYTLTAASAGYQPVAATIRLDADTPVEHDLDLPLRARLVGTVVAAGSGRGIEEATATLVDAEGVIVGSTLTGRDGSFAFDDLPAGTYTLTARGYAPVAQTVHVTAGVQATADIALGPVAATVTPKPVEVS